MMKNRFPVQFKIVTSHTSADDVSSCIRLFVDHLYKTDAPCVLRAARGIKTSVICMKYNKEQDGFGKGRTFIRPLTITT